MSQLSSPRHDGDLSPATCHQTPQPSWPGNLNVLAMYRQVPIPVSMLYEVSAA